MFKKVSVLLAVFGFMFVSASSLYAVNPDDVLGVWQTAKDLAVEDGIKITIYKCGEKYCGKISWMKDPESLDDNNKDKSLRNRKLLGIDMISGFVFDDDEWEDGEIYNLQDGKTYSSEMALEGMDILNVKGCVLFFCKKMPWYRVK